MNDPATTTPNLDTPEARLAALDACTDDGYLNEDDSYGDSQFSIDDDTTPESDTTEEDSAPAKTEAPKSSALRAAASAVKAAKAEAASAKAEAQALAALLGPLVAKLEGALATKQSPTPTSDSSDDDYDSYEDPADTKIRELEAKLAAIEERHGNAAKARQERAIASETAKLEAEWVETAKAYPWLADPDLAQTVMTACERDPKLTITAAAKRIADRLGMSASPAPKPQAQTPSTQRKFVPPVSTSPSQKPETRKSISPFDAAAARLARMQIAD